MKEKEHPTQEKEKDEPTVTVKVNIHGDSAPDATVKEGTPLNEILTDLARSHHLNLAQFRIVLNGTQIDITKENPLILENCTLILLKDFKGGR